MCVLGGERGNLKLSIWGILKIQHRCYEAMHELVKSNKLHRKQNVIMFFLKPPDATCTAMTDG